MAAKKKSTVNKAGNYTKPTMRKNLFNKIKASTKGGKAGQWSARKAQMLAKQYKASRRGLQMKGVNHYKKDGTLHTGGTHKMPDGSLHSRQDSRQDECKTISFEGLVRYR